MRFGTLSPASGLARKAATGVAISLAAAFGGAVLFAAPASAAPVQLVSTSQFVSLRMLSDQEVAVDNPTAQSVELVADIVGYEGIEQVDTSTFAPFGWADEGAQTIGVVPAGVTDYSVTLPSLDRYTEYGVQQITLYLRGTDGAKLVSLTSPEAGDTAQVESSIPPEIEVTAQTPADSVVDVADPADGATPYLPDTPVELSIPIPVDEITIDQDGPSITPRIPDPSVTAVVPIPDEDASAIQLDLPTAITPRELQGAVTISGNIPQDVVDVFVDESTTPVIPWTPVPDQRVASATTATGESTTQADAGPGGSAAPAPAGAGGSELAETGGQDQTFTLLGGLGLLIAGAGARAIRRRATR